MKHIYQKTVKKSVTVTSIGLHSGKKVKLSLKPNNEGIIFYRKDLNRFIELNIDNIIDTKLATTIGNKDFSISTIEHLLSALFAYGIDNIIIEVDGPELPIMDGSAIPFCMMIEESNIDYIEKYREIMIINKKLEIKDGKKIVSIEPNNSLVFDYKIDFKNSVIGIDNYKFHFSFNNYISQIARARTFGLLSEINYLRSNGLALGGSLDNAIVVDNNKILNPDGLRFEHEFVKHKILDAIGDLKILNYPILGKYKAYMGSHNLNYLLSKAIIEQKCYEVTRLSDLDLNIIKQYSYYISHWS